MNTTDVLAILSLIAALGYFSMSSGGLSHKGGRHTKKHHKSGKKTRRHH